MRNKVAILVVSCDDYSDLWDAFFELFFRFWPECKFDIYLQTNFKDYNKYKVSTIKVGEDKSWSHGLSKAIDSLNKYEYVFLFLEDLFLEQKVNNDEVLTIIDSFTNIDGNYLTFISEPSPDQRFNKKYGKISKGSMYRITATAALWKRETLKKLIKPDENAWEFEKLGSRRSDKFEGFYSVYSSKIIYFNSVVKGYWTREAVKKLKNLDISVESDREVNSIFQEILFNIYKSIRRFIIIVTPFNLRKKLVKKV